MLLTPAISSVLHGTYLSSSIIWPSLSGQMNYIKLLSVKNSFYSQLFQVRVSVSLSNYLWTLVWTYHTGTNWSTNPGNCCLPSDTAARCFICLSSFWIWNQLIWVNSRNCALLACGVKWNLCIKTKESQESAGQGVTPLSGNKFLFFFPTQTETVKTGRKKTPTVALVCHLCLSSVYVLQRIFACACPCR